MHAPGIVFLAQICISVVQSFNLDLLHPLVYQQSNLDYFGFSIALHGGGRYKKDTPWMMVGAPKANNTAMDRKNSLHTGKVYKCGFKQVCEKMKLEYAVGHKVDDEDWDNAMLGSIMDMHENRFVVCAPNPKIRSYSYRTGEKNKILMKGACYWGISDSNAYFRRISIDTYSNNRWPEAAFSAQLMLGPQGEIELLLGASMTDRTGAIVILSDGIRGVLNYEFVKKQLMDFKQTPYGGLFGYSVTSGKYFSKNNVTQVAGAPSKFSTGEVLCFNYKTRRVEQTLKGEQFGEYFGSSLASGDLNGDGLDDLLIGAPLYTNNRQGVDAQNEGRVFVYLGSYSKIFVLPSMNHRITGQDYNGRFGSTVACIGDIDLDKYMDFAIAAPYSESGIVFIYKGSERGLMLSQKIVGSQVFPNVKGFGFGISRGQDMDKNGYNDIAIGAYKSGHAIILRSKPVIDMDASITILGSNPSLDAKELETEICVKYSGKFAPDYIRVVMTLTMDPGYFRMYRNGNSSQRTSHDELVVYSTGYCAFFSFTIKDNINYIHPIKISGEFFLAPDNTTKSTPILLDMDSNHNISDRFCPTCPILRGNTVTHTTEVGFNFGCRVEFNCKANLALDFVFINSTGAKISSFVIGSYDSVTLKITLTNTGDPAFNTKLYVTVPSLPISMPVTCRDATNGTEILVECDGGNPLKNNTRRDFEFRFEIQGAIVTAKSINISANVKSGTPLENPKLPSSGVFLPLVSQAGITVFGNVEEEIYRFEVNSDNKQASKVSTMLSYQIQKYGVSPLEEVLLKVDIPVASVKGDSFLYISSPKFYLDSRPLVCESNEYILSDSPASNSAQTFNQRDSHVLTKRDVPKQVENTKYPANRTLFINCTQNDWKCTRLFCRTEILFSTQISTLQLKLNLDMSLLERSLGQKDIVILGTKAFVEIITPVEVEHIIKQSSDIAQVSVVLLRHIPAGKVDVWVIAVAVIGGILLLSLFIVGLFKAGFFKRKERENLLSLKSQTEMAVSSGSALTDREHGVENLAFEEEIQLDE